MTRLRYRVGKDVIVRGALVVVLAISVLVVMAGRWDSVATSEEGWHVVATTTYDGRRIHPMPAVHPVIVASPVGARDTLLSILPPPLGTGDISGIEGLYRPEDGSIHIVGKVSRFEATLPGALQGTLRHTLRHEYGHAFLQDWLSTHGMDRFSPAYLELAQPDCACDPDRFPEQLAPVLTAYADARADVYGSTYFTSSFEEFFAESYARFVEGRSVPGPVDRFFSEQVVSDIHGP